MNVKVTGQNHGSWSHSTVRSHVFCKLFTESVLKANFNTIFLQSFYNKLCQFLAQMTSWRGCQTPKVKTTMSTVYKATTWPLPPLVRETLANINLYHLMCNKHITNGKPLCLVFMTPQQTVQYKYWFIFSAICKVAAGNQLVVEGWAVFEDAAEEAGPGQLPTLCRQLVSNVTPTLGTPRLTPTPMDTGIALGSGEGGPCYVKKRICWRASHY